MLTLWGRINSINVMKVLWTLDELGVKYRRIDAGLEHGKVNDADYRAMNPNGRIPVINDDGFTLWESNVIVRYLSYKYALGTLYPADMRQRAEAEQWMDWQQTTLSPEIVWPFQGLVRRAEAYRDEARIQAAATTLSDLFGILDAHLADRDYVMGDEFTMADIPLGATVWRWFKLPIKRVELSNVAAWQERLLARDAYRAHVAHPLT